MHSPLRYGNPPALSLPRVRMGAALAVACATLLCFPESFAQTPGISGVNVFIQRISTDQGLSDRTVYAITQDSRGFIWVGTNDGLNRYDGQNFTIYRNIPGDTTSLSNNQVLSLCEDNQGYLWIGTGRGLNRFDPETRLFRRYFHDPADSATISDDEIRSIYKDRRGVLWVGTARGLNNLERRTGVWRRFSPEPYDSSKRGYNVITCMLEDRAGTFWIGTRNFFEPGSRLFTFDRREGTFSLFPEFASLSKEKNISFMTSLYEDASGALWVGWSHGRDLYAFDRSSGKFRAVPLPLEPGTGPGTIQCFAGDSRGVLWVGSWTWGLFSYDRRTGEIAHYRYQPGNPRTVSSPDICTLFLDKSGLLWVGTYQGGVTTVARNPFLHRTTLGASFSISRKIDWLLGDREGNLWLGSIANGVWRFDPRSQKATRFLSDRSTAMPVLQDREGAIWILSNGGDGIFIYDPHTQSPSVAWRFPEDSRESGNRLFIDSDQSLWVSSFNRLYRVFHDRKRYERYDPEPGNPQSLTGGSISAICEDSLGRIWVATDRGVNRFDKVTKLFARFVHDRDSDSSLSSNTVTGIFVDRSGTVWIGTEDGLNRFNEKSGAFSRFFPADSRASRSIGQILQDKGGCLWFTTNAGIVMFDPSAGLFRTFDERMGVESVEFLPWCSPATLPSGEFVFGCSEGVLVFHPDSIKGLPCVPPIVITGIRKFNQPVGLSTSPELLREVTLEHEENVFSVGFAALSYERPDLNCYAYMLDGFDRDWVYCSTRREASYSNLNPGIYTFRVKGSNHAGVWNEAGASMTVIVKPAYWQTLWFRSIAIVLVVGLLFIAYRLRLNQMRLKHQAEIEHFQVEHLAEVDRLKSRFFSNISHEFRTPLTLILGPADDLLASTDEPSSRHKLQTVKDNARRLFGLVNQLLDFSRLESGMMRLQATPGDIVTFLRRVVMSFESWAERKHIRLEFRSDAESVQGFFDADKLEKIINNLMSNALKFTAEGGRVSVHVGVAPPPVPESSPGKCPPDRLLRAENVRVSVADTGSGISSRHLSRIFERFYRVDETHTTEGAGIGLALTKELVDLHHGTITVESAPGEGSVFSVTIPVRQSAYATDEIRETVPEPGRRESIEQAISEVVPGPSPSIPSPDGKPIVLVVEDNAELRAYLREHLQSEYAVYEAENGKAGYDRAVESVPDIVVSDVMMPEMDGMELCRALKQDLRTSHVPVILLTARADTDSKLGGLEIGADDYVTKPFDSKELLARVRNLIEQRQKLRKKFSEGIVLKPGEVAVSSLDSTLLKNAIEVVERYIGNENFGVEELAREVSMSRATLNRKLHAITNLSPVEFIRCLRLQRARELLEKNAGSIAEIAYQVGFQSPSYFTATFHERFGVPPSEIPRKSG